MSILAAYVATPGLTVAGQDQPELADNLLALDVECDIVGLSRCVLTVRNWGQRNGRPGYLYADRDLLDFGAELSVALGPDRTTVFSGTISAIAADYRADDVAQATVHAEDALYDLRLTRRTRTFEDSSLGAVADRIAGAHGLRARVDVPPVQRAVVAQLNQSDLALLRGLARQEDAEVWLDGRDLHVARRPGRGVGADVPRLAYGANLLSFAVRADLADQVSEVRATGWSVADKDAIDEAIGAGELGAELGSLTSGTAVLEEARGRRTEPLVRGVPLAADEARALARAAYLERARRFVTGTAVTGGTPAARVGGPVELGGLGTMFEGRYTVTRVRHTYDLHTGLRTHLDVERPGIGGAR
ncbi:phage late control D family protein [Propioniciclava sinopodophylli]|uniref:Phage late control D family protein n=1 Tax=Propioniciclava sinopodophylli TaxID=1837344 RepID=A0A4Q9KCN6_9ACTN|nr:contractile injection system protein, VgrG/Pvc8 family [Propioniciclava sinopodophylli]TBT82599.1 phage late control D family protein [Propioniciclava sinopodophylli]